MRSLFPVSLLVCVALLVPEALLGQSISARNADLTVGGRLQSQYSTSSAADGESEFFFRRARLELDVTLNDRIDGRLHPDFAGGSVSVKDAWVRFRVSPAFAVSVGQFKRAFDLFELSSSADLPLIERDGRMAGVDDCAGVGGVCSYSRLLQGLAYVDRDQGVLLAGDAGTVSWQATLTNGSGANHADENDAKSFSGRLAVPLGGRFTLGGNAGLHDYLAPNGDTDRGAAWGLDLEYGGWMDGLHLQAGVAGGDNWRALDAAGDPTGFFAAQGLATWYTSLDAGPVVGVEPLVRVSVAEPVTERSGGQGLLLTPGFAAYFARRNMISVNLDVYDPAGGGAEFSDAGTGYSLKVQSFFYF